MGNCLGGTKSNDVETQNVDSSLIGGRSSLGRPSLHSGIIRMRNVDVFSKYKTIEVLGQGSMGFVQKVQIREGAEGGSAVSEGKQLSERRLKKVDYALKQIVLEKVNPIFMDEMRNEIDILRVMDHPNIVKAHEVYNYKKCIYIVLELCDGEDLYTGLPYSEREAAYISGKLLSAVKYMHDHGIVHRDLKFENIIFENKNKGAEIKVIDFGLSKKFVSSKVGTMHDRVGTLYSMSPQVLQGIYTSQADMWSCGVIIYMLLSSHRPFYSKTRKIMIDRIMKCDYTFEKDYWKPISDEAKDMISNLLVINPKQRMDATKAQKHIWLSNEFKLSDRKPDQTTADAVQDNLINYKDNHALKKVALNLIAHQSSTDEILELRKLFDQYDTANNGIISYDEFTTALKAKNYSEEKVAEIFESLDINQNGCIMYTEFIAASLEAQGHIEEERLAEAFDRLDSDDSGYISKKNLAEFLGKSEHCQEIDEIVKDIDEDGDGQISYEEFLQLFQQRRQAAYDQNDDFNASFTGP